MSKQKPSLPKGMRDFGPEVMVRRNYILQTIRSTFEKFGYQPLETPTMENLSVLTGKYGDEGDQLLFKVLNSGDFLSGINAEDIEKGYRHVLPQLSNKGLRYDLTVPFARYVVMNRHDLAFPFKRYQIQPVWRADRPQKSRYREFYQCDADVVGTNSLICEAEIFLMINEIFGKLGIRDFSIKINHRQILNGMAEVCGYPQKLSELCVAIDKLDKIGKEKVFDELEKSGFSNASLDKLLPFLEIEGETTDKIAEMHQLLSSSESGQQGLGDLNEIFNYLDQFGLRNTHIEFDPVLARGLSYYTGTILEVKINNVEIGSVSGGGRYDDLTGVFGLPDVSGVGFSFGVDRLYDVMEELDLFPKEQLISTKVLVIPMDESSMSYSLGILAKLRQEGLNSEVFPEIVKLKKSMNFANKKAIPYVILIGSEEVNQQRVTLKNMQTGEQIFGELEDVLSNIEE